MCVRDLGSFGVVLLDCSVNAGKICLDGSVTTQIPDPGFGGVTEMVSER